jgi:flagellar basal-body rod protein FlgC
MDINGTFAISGSGMSVEKMRLDVTALNLANVHSTRARDGSGFEPLQVISAARAPRSFQAAFGAAALSMGLPAGAEVLEVRAARTAPRLVHEPNHPDADARGYVAYPGINPVNEMVTLISSLRAYEANVAALNAAKTMALKALELGGN